jgi:hypothetical protein
MLCHAARCILSRIVPGACSLEVKVARVNSAARRRTVVDALEHALGVVLVLLEVAPDIE